MREQLLLTILISNLLAIILITFAKAGIIIAIWNIMTYAYLLHLSRFYYRHKMNWQRKYLTIIANLIVSRACSGCKKCVR